MSGTPTIATTILSRLAQDTAITSVLTGGIYERELKREGPGATPDAFATTAPFQPRPAAVVVDPDSNRDLSGLSLAFHAFPWVYVYAERHANGKTAIATALDLISQRLHGWRMPLPNGTGATVQEIGRLGTRDDEDNAGRAVGGIRLQVDGLWRNAN